MRVSRAIVAITATLALGACSLFVSLDDLSGGSDAGPSGEAGANDAIPNDAGDATSSDAHQEAGPPFCTGFSTPPTLCDDFDETPLGAVWDAIDSQDAGTMALDKTNALSPPATLLTTIPDPVNDVNDEGVGLTKTWTSAATAGGSIMHCEIDLRVEQDGSLGDFIAMLIRESPDDPDITYSSFVLVAGPNPWGMQEYDEFTDGGDVEPGEILIAGPATGLWRHLIVDFDFKDHIAMYGVSDTQLDGTTIDAGTVTTAIVAPQNTFSRSITIGVQPSFAPSGTKTWQARFDNVWCNFTP